MRPTKLVPDTMRAVLLHVRSGNYMETAAAYAGVHKDSLYEWLKRGAADGVAGKSPTRWLDQTDMGALLTEKERGRGSIHLEFSSAIERAMAESEMRDLDVIRKSSTGVASAKCPTCANKGVDTDVFVTTPGNWTAAAWRLERRFNKKWGQRYKVETVITSADIKELMTALGSKVEARLLEHVGDATLRATIVQDISNDWLALLGTVTGNANDLSPA